MGNRCASSPPTRTRACIAKRAFVVLNCVVDLSLVAFGRDASPFPAWQETAKQRVSKGFPEGFRGFPDAPKGFQGFPDAFPLPEFHDVGWPQFSLYKIRRDVTPNASAPLPHLPALVPHPRTTPPPRPCSTILRSRVAWRVPVEWPSCRWKPVSRVRIVMGRMLA